MASKKLADLLLEKPHLDGWFNDFLNAYKPGDNAGLVALQQTIQFIRQQHFEDAHKSADAAALWFRKKNNLPGELRARYVAVYADQRSLNGQACLDDAAQLETRLRSTSYHELLARLLIDKSICERRAGRPGEIDKTLDESQKVAEGFKYQSFNLRVLGISTGLKKESGDCKAAWQESAKGLEIYWQGRHLPERLFQFYQPLSECAEKQQLWRAASVIRDHAIKIRESVDKQNGKDSLLLATLYLDSANIDLALQRNDSAQNALKRAFGIFQANGETPTARKYRFAVMLRQADIQLQNSNPDVALHTLEPLLDPSIEDASISMWASRALGDIHRAKGDLTLSEKAYKDGIVLSEKSLTTLLESKDRLAWVAEVDKLYRGLDEVWIKENRQTDAWKLWEWYKSRSIQVSHGEKTLFSPDLTWPQLEGKILNQVSSDDAIPRITYAVFDDGVQAWIVSRNKVTATWKGVSKATVEQKTLALFDRASNPDSSLTEVWNAGAELNSILWQPLAADLPASGTVIVELDSPIQHLLLEAVRADGHYLFDKYQFVYSPGVLMDKGLRATKTVDGKSPTFLLDASASSGESPIPSQVREVRTVSKEFANVNRGDGASVTLPQVQTDLQNGDIFLFAGHGLRNGDDLALVVNQNLLVRSTDLLPAHLNRLQLAILAACSTGTSDQNGLLDTRSLDNSFLAAGVPRVISSRWDVDSDSTADLIEGIFIKLSHRVPVAQAMYSVQQDILKKEQHPYYWAGFYLAGKAN